MRARIFIPRVKRHSALRGAGKSRGRLYVNFYTTDFTSRGAFVCPALPRVLWSAYPQSRYYVGTVYSLRHRDPAGRAECAFPSLRLAGAYGARNMSEPRFLCLFYDDVVRTHLPFTSRDCKIDCGAPPSIKNANKSIRVSRGGEIYREDLFFARVPFLVISEAKHWYKLNIRMKNINFFFFLRGGNACYASPRLLRLGEGYVGLGTAVDAVDTVPIPH